ncbi:hypothetical protein [Pseudactinotalea sp.]|uniref:hypothetical protein n=1 Tax=Pseudactinotalea sp. TaxID=1926260 RepID=UPI003B3B063B
MYGLLLSILSPIALVIIGVVMAPKAGPARGRMWLGLVLMLVGSVIGLIWQAALTMPQFFHSMIDSLGHPAFGAISAVISVITSGFFIAGVAVLASAVVLGRHAVGSLDPNRPGAAPTTYQGTGYPTTGQKPHEPGSNPYV